MRYFVIVISLLLGLTNCQTQMKTNQELFLVEEIPNQTPITFKPSLTPADKIIHRGVFSPDFQAYYYTISDKKFEKFDVLVIKKENGVWSTPSKVFFNSEYSEHGMSFSSDGNTLYFNSTRPTNVEGVASTWHIWKSEKVNGKWSTPTFVDIPNCREKLVSHPSVAKSGNLYFHVSNPDYSNMEVCMAKLTNGVYGNAKSLNLDAGKGSGSCTPYISPKEDYLIFAQINDGLSLWIALKDSKGNWTETRAFNEKINQQNQGNPSITPDGNFLFFATGDHQGNNWKVKWVNIATELAKMRAGN